MRIKLRKFLLKINQDKLKEDDIMEKEYLFETIRNYYFFSSLSQIHISWFSSFEKFGILSGNPNNQPVQKTHTKISVKN